MLLSRFIGESRIVRASDVVVSDKKFRVNPPEGWEEEEEKEKKRHDEELSKASKEVAELREEELKNLEVLKEQIVAEGKKEASVITNAARRESERMVAEAVAEAEKQRTAIIDEAKKAGHDEGVAKGKKEGERLRGEAAQALEEAKAVREATLRNLEPELVNLVIGISEKLIHDRMAFHPSLILNLIKAGLNETVTSDSITVRVSPDDYEAAAEGKDELLRVVSGAKLEIIKDLSLNKSDCIIETSFGYIDCSLDRQMDALRENLHHICSGNSGL